MRHTKASAGLATDPIELSSSEETNARRRLRSPKRPGRGRCRCAYSWDAEIDQIVSLFPDKETGQIVGELAWKDDRLNSFHPLDELHRYGKNRVRELFPDAEDRAHFVLDARVLQKVSVGFNLIRDALSLRLTYVEYFLIQRRETRARRCLSSDRRD